MQFMGYKRSEGRAGIRNHVLILPTCACGSESSRIVASQVRGAVNIVFNTGCSDVAANTAMSQKILTGFACNPNVYGVVIIGLGCETVPHRALREKIEAMTKKPVVSFGIQEEGGTLKTIEKATRAARIMAAEAALQQKEPCDISELLLGIECGGSDATSGIASNPAVGNLSDRLVDLGATTIMSESIEWIGGEHVLARRAATPEIHNQIIKICEDYEKHLLAAGQDCRAGQPTPGNKDGGLST
ncbi:MAG: UxaA family hydrolase, partial [Schwartzia sp.]|nr:UxaA family hydrolase [Schwartzia sp. (in: firmicutes)]